MNGRRLFAGIMGIFFLSYGTLSLFLFSGGLGRGISEGLGSLVPTYSVTATGYSFSVGSLVPIVQAIFLILGGAVIAWRRKKWAVIVGILGASLLAITSLSLQVLVAVAGGPALGELIDLGEIVIGLGTFALLPIVGIVISWRELN